MAASAFCFYLYLAASRLFLSWGNYCLDR